MRADKAEKMEPIEKIKLAETGSATGATNRATELRPESSDVECTEDVNGNELRSVP